MQATKKSNAAGIHFVLHTFLRRGRKKKKIAIGERKKQRGREEDGARENAVENIVQRARSEVDNDNRANNEAFLMWPLNNGNEDNAHTHTHTIRMKREANEAHWLQWTAVSKN